MPVVKGGVWTNIEDEILKAAVSKYGLNQWARVSSLLARKTPKQCKARWSEWLDPGIRKIEWSKEEDEKLLHLAKLMPTQWRTIAPIVGRTATQCLERYQKLLDEAEARESREMGLMGPDGGETMAPTADDVRRLRPGELDPDPESKPARPDTIDLDEDEKEMLSEARARLANTQGKKAKRKARERQLEESRRLAVLQKRRELKNAGINIKVVTRKKGQMDYNADVPFERAPAPGFYDTVEEGEKNERQREAFDPRKQQLANKRKGDPSEELEERNRKKNNNKSGSSAALEAAAKAGKMQKIREAEQSSKRRPLVLPAPQVSEGELDDIVKMGMSGERAGRVATDSENDATRSLVGNYSQLINSTPIRTPRAPQEEDRIANEIKNARARTQTQSALLGGENALILEGDASTGFEGSAPTRQQLSTPNPMATPLRAAGASGALGTPMRTPSGAGPGTTPLRTPRDNFHLNPDGGAPALGHTPRDVKLAETLLKHSLKSRLAALPRPKQTDWELELPEEKEEIQAAVSQEEDAADRDRRLQLERESADRTEFARQSQVLQKGLPIPSGIDLATLFKASTTLEDRSQAAIADEMYLLIANDVSRFRRGKVIGSMTALEVFDDELLDKARLQIALELSSPESQRAKADFEISSGIFDQPAVGTMDDEAYGESGASIAAVASMFKGTQKVVMMKAQKGNDLEKRLAKLLGGYQQRAKLLRQKIVDASHDVELSRDELNVSLTAQVVEEAAISSRLSKLRQEVSYVSRRERESQELYRYMRDDLAQFSAASIGTV